MNKLTMRKVLVAIGALLGTVVYTFAGDDISMVTYYPVPYVAYNALTVSEQLDVGMQRGEGGFTLTLGSETDKPSLDAQEVHLLKSKLSFNTDLYSKAASFGNGTSTATLTFLSNLRVGTSIGAPGKSAKSLTATTATVSGDVAMINSEFQNGGASLKTHARCDKTVQWTNLPFNNEDHMFLTCGQTTNTDKECKSWKLERVEGTLTCTYSSADAGGGTAYQDLLGRASDLEGALTDENGIVRYSRCSVGTVSWRYQEIDGHPNLFLIEGMAGKANNTCETWASHYSALISEGFTCLSIGAAGWLKDCNNPAVTVPSCGYSLSEGSCYSGRVRCGPDVSFEWYKSDNENGDDAPTLYKAVCADEE